jgi:hypothetical protein
MAKLPYLEWGERSGSGDCDDIALWPDSLQWGGRFAPNLPSEDRAGLPGIGARSNITVAKKKGEHMLRSLVQRRESLAAHKG